MFFLISLLSLAVAHDSSAQDFTALSLGDYGNVTVMEVTGNYDAINPDGTQNTAAREAIAKELYRLHKDEYDFLVLFSNFPYQLPATDIEGFYIPVKNDTQGIGVEPFDNTSFFGSNGTLQGIVEMGNIGSYVTDPLDPKFEETLYVLNHELLHRWGAYVKFKDSAGNLSTALLGRENSHWSYLLNSYGSVMLGNQWQDNGNGTFTSIAAQKYYSPLDLYLMGFIDKSKVPPMLLIDNPFIDPAKLPQVGATIAGTSRYVTIDDIIAAAGPRVPAASTSQKSFKIGFILVTTPGAFTGNEIYGIENIRNGEITRFSVLTDGKSIIEIASTPKEDLPTNPGVLPPTTTPRTLPPNIEDGINWLVSNQQLDGSWTDDANTIERDTSQAVRVLKDFAVAQQNYQSGLAWLAGVVPDNADYLAKKIETLAVSGQDVLALVQQLLAIQNSDGGWGKGKDYWSNPADTALALKALSYGGYSDQQIISKAIGYLKSQQNPDGGWGSEDKGGMVQETSNVLSAFNAYRTSYQLEDAISLGTSWLIAKQNPDGGFGNSPSTVYDTANALLTLQELNASADVTYNALSYLFSQQSENGSWNNSTFQTALAVLAVYKSTVDPDLSIKSEDITIIPETIRSLPSNIVINANIWNLGRTAVPQARVVLYEGDPSTGSGRVGEQTLAFPGQSSTAVTFFATARDGNEHRFYIVIDPENEVKEPNKLNNSAVKVLYPEATYDFEILSSDVTVSANTVNMQQDVTLTAKITNKGTMNAYNVQVRYFIDEPGAPFEIGTKTLDIPANGSVTDTFTWRANKAGANLPVSVQADPFDNFGELSETNNKGAATLTVNSATRPNLVISYSDLVITPSPANEGGNATISALIKNEGLSTANNILVNFYKGVPGADGVVLGNSTIPSLAQGQSTTVSFNWTNIQEVGEKVVYVRVDPDSRIAEIREDDNDAFTILNILSLPDLVVSDNSITITPAFPKDGDSASITVTIQNSGMQAAQNVIVNLVEGNTTIGSTTVPLISGASQADATFAFETAGKTGTHQLTIEVDPGNNIVEKSKDNNAAAKTIIVQDADFWLSEQYISPNGDGVKDNTQLSFRFNAPQTVRVVVIDSAGETVRTFNGSGLTNVQEGNIIWDGLDDNGMVVADGQYQLKVLDASNTTVNSALVTVDNNQSPLTDALGTEYLTTKNVSCNLRNLWEGFWHWMPDDSGLVFSVDYDPYSSPKYYEGIYIMSPDGLDIQRLVPWDWQWKASDTNKRYNSYIPHVSPDGTRIAFTADHISSSTNELWIVDVDGKNQTLVDQNVYDDYIWTVGPVYVKWSPDSKYLIYFKANNSIYDLWIVNAQTMERRKIEASVATWFVEWSPDSKRIAYGRFTGSYNSFEAKIADAAALTITNTAITTQEMFWLNTDKLILTTPQNTLWLVDATVGGNTIMLPYSINAGDSFMKSVFIAPDRQHFAFQNDHSDETNYLYVSDSEGNVSIVHEFDYPYQRLEYSSYSLSYIGWSLNSKNLFFLETTYDSKLGYPQTLHYVDMTAKTEKTFGFKSITDDWVRYYNPVTFEALPGDQLLIAVNGDSYYVLDAKTGQSSLLVSYPTDILYKKLVSPLGHYIAYHQWDDTSYGCVNNYSALHIISSLLNLTADLRAAKGTSSVILKGIAADLNFDSYQLEYTDAGNPGAWNLIAPPSNFPVLNDVFTTWVPPYKGSFYVRLTVRDKAGNTAISRKKVSWGLSSSITNLSKSLEIFSPNGDGVKDTVELHYKVLEPVHLEFDVYDENKRLLKTLYKDHASPAEDYISWDGTDQSGISVPDGSYTISVFDYVFFVVVDNTPPDVTIALGKISATEYHKEPYKLFVNLNSHAYDDNFRNWTIEYGEGDNPQTWHTLLSNDSPLGKRDEQGNLIKPIEDTTVKSYWGTDIGWLKRKKLRISGEDSAGNKHTAITEFVEEKFVFYAWDNGVLQPDIDIPANSVRPGPHTIGSFETIRSSIAGITVQYLADDGHWHDSQAAVNSEAGSLKLQWDTSTLQQDLYVVRLKAVDISGRVYYSSEIGTSSMFAIKSPLCSRQLAANNFVREKLSVLKLQVKSNEDANYPVWTDFKIFDAAKGDVIPEGRLTFLPPIVFVGIKYDVRMVGTGESGKAYISDPTGYPPRCPIKITLDVSPKIADCGSLSNSSVLRSIIEYDGTLSNVALKTLSYYLETGQGLQLLYKIDNAISLNNSATIDTSSLTEGSYTVKAVLNYTDLDDNTPYDVSSEPAALIIDKTLPTAHLTYPSNSVRICPVKISFEDGEKYVIPLEGIADDTDRISQYDVYYNTGEDTVEWSHTGVWGPSSKTGTLGEWDITNVVESDFSLKLKVVDKAGNSTCATAAFSTDTAIEITSLSINRELFSPNDDSVADEAWADYQVDEYAAIDAKAFKLVKAAGGNYTLDAAPVRTIVSGAQHVGGIGTVSWDGKDDAGSIVPDGHYGVAVTAIDTCGNAAQKWETVEVDNTPPTTEIGYPQPGAPVGNVIEVKGTAFDVHFQNFTLEAGADDNPDTWSSISSNGKPVTNNILGTWNTFGLSGKWTLRLSATDNVGNKNESRVVVDLGARKNLIKSLSASPSLFSPNGDGKLDTVTIQYELTDTSDVTIEIITPDNLVRKVHTISTVAAGVSTWTWNGTDEAGVVLPDNAYEMRLTAALSSMSEFNQTESITVSIDTTPPTVDMQQPVANSFVRNDITVTGSISDLNIAEYSVSYAGPSGAVQVDEGSQERVNHAFAIINDLPDGTYTLNLKAKDIGENAAEKNITFTVDRTAPVLTLNTPKDGGYYGGENAVITISGAIDEKNLDTYSLRYGTGEDPSEWTELTGGTVTPPDQQLFTWDVGPNSGLSDELYTVSLLVVDKAGSASDARAKLTIDNTMPIVSITSPEQGALFTAATEIAGTAYDQNLEKYTVEMSKGQCFDAYQWSAIKTGSSSVQNSVLVLWQALPLDGVYCLRTTVFDKAGNSAEAKVDVNVDINPPPAPILSGAIENRTNVRLSWASEADSGLSYNVYRDGVRINQSAITQASYIDLNLAEGLYVYTVKAVDFAGLESGLSNQIPVKIDLTGPDARIQVPQDGSRVSGIVDIKGTAYSADDFRLYRVSVSSGSTPVSWMLLRTSPLPITYGVLAQWDTLSVSEGLYSFKLEAEDTAGNMTSKQITVSVDNTPPARPSLLSAVPSGSNVTITWQSNTEQDLAGYLLYRNDQLVNATGIAIGDLKPYLISGVTYLDRSVSDGVSGYYLVAMDQAGNTSDPSNIIQVNIDSRSPVATITNPVNLSAFDGKTLIQADSPDSDIASVQFQYKRSTASVWVNLGSAAVARPYAVHLDPSRNGLTYGDYNVRAVAKDIAGKTDAAPSYITVTYKDITSPAVPNGVTVQTIGNSNTVTWNACTETDLAGYNVYRTSGGTRIKINTTIVQQAVYQDSSLADGEYSYEVTAIDAIANESNPSNAVSTKIYAPILQQPETYTEKGNLQILGGNAAPNAIVEIFVNNGDGPFLKGSTDSDGEGNFTFVAALQPGDNTITARASDAGNISRDSDAVYILYNAPPAAPTGLTATNQNFDVMLSWDPNSEQDIVGYNVYRKSEKIIFPDAKATGTASASSTSEPYVSFSPSMALDDDLWSMWLSKASFYTFSPVSWEVDFGEHEFINHIEITWYIAMYSGRDYEIQFWNNSEWITQIKVIANNSEINYYDIEPTFATSKVRIYITDTNYPYSTKYVAIRDIQIKKQDFVKQTLFKDLNLPDGQYQYTVTAVDRYGLESAHSNQVNIGVGDVTPPSAPTNLSAMASDSDIILTWSASPQSDVVGYNIFRGTTSGGPYTKINTTLIDTNNYLDTSKTTSIYRYYVASAVDAVGNESAFSSEAFVTIVDNEAPEKPVIYEPAISGMPVTLQSSTTTISGFTEAAASVELFRDDVSQGKVLSSEKPSIQQVTIPLDAYSAALSPDENIVAYVRQGALWLKQLDLGIESQVLAMGYQPKWSPDGRNLAFSYFDNSGIWHLGIYNIQTTSSKPLTGDSAREYAPVWSPDGTKIAFQSNRNGNNDIWIKDLVTDTITPVILSETYKYGQEFSPEGNLLAYFDQGNLYVIDLKSGGTILIDDNASGSVAWSPDGKAVSFVSYRDGFGDVYTFQLETGSRVKVVSIETYDLDVYPIIWAHGGQHIVYDLYDYMKGNDSVWIAPAFAQGQSRLIKDDVYLIGKTNKGGIIYSSYDNDMENMYLEGHFSFTNMPLKAGENVFYVKATDAAGNVSVPSDAISVIYNAGLLPDVTTTLDDLHLYPPYPVENEETAINISLWNKGQVEVKDVDVLVYMWNARGELELLKSERVVSITPESAELISAVWDSKGKTGENRLVVVLDPEDKLAESSESNNMAIKDFIVTSNRGVAITTALDSTQYGSEQDVGIKITVWNNGINKDVILDAQIEDENGKPVVVFDSKAISLAYGTNTTNDIIWNTGSTYVGTYSVRTLVKEASGTVLDENILSFTIIPDTDIDLTIVTDKLSYGPGESLSINCKVINSGINYIIPAFQAKVRINDSAGTLFFTETKNLANILPGATVSLSAAWNTGLSQPGDYAVNVELSHDGQTIATKSASFKVNAVMTLTGSVTVAPSPVPLGGIVQTNYTIANSGNIDAVDITAKIIVADPKTGVGITTHEEEITIARDSSWAGQYAFTTEGYSLQTYAVMLQIVQQGSVKNLSSASFNVKDLITPVIAVQSPVEGTIYNSTIPVVALLSDNASGVDKAEYRIADGTWKLLPLSDPSTGRYAIAWEPTITDNGHKTVSFRATDKSGNTSSVVAVGFEIQMDIEPPVTTISIGAPKYEIDGKFAVNGSTAFTLSAIDNFSGVAKTEYRIGGGSWTAYAPFTVAGEGEYTIHYYSMDNLNNTEAFRTISVMVDNAAPMTTITTGDPKYTAPDGKLYIASGAMFRLAATDNISGVAATEYRIDGGNWTTYTPFTIPTEGTHKIDYYSKDNVANTESYKTLAAVVDNTPPVTTITTGDPKYNAADGTIYVSSGASLTLTATDNLSEVAKSEYRIDNNPWTPYAPFTVAGEGMHTIDFYSLDNVTNRETFKTINVIVDNTPPVTAITSGGIKYTAADGTVYASSVGTSTLTAMDELSGVAKTEYRLCDGAWIAYAPFNLGAEGGYSIGYRSVDNVQNPEMIKTFTVTIDKTPPVSEIMVEDPTYTASDGKLYVTSESAFTLVAIDNLSGVAKTEYRIDNGQWQAYAPFTVSGDGAHTIFYRSADNVGNTETEKNVSVIVDNTPPVTNLTVGDPKFTASNGKLYSAGVSMFTLTATDNLSGLANIEYRIDGGAWFVYSAAFSISEEGDHTVDYRSRDNATNLEEFRRLSVAIDRTPPVTEPSIGTHTFTSQEGELYIAGISTIMFMATDNLSGVRKTEYRIDNGQPTTYAAFTLAGEGSHTIGFWSSDNVTNTETEKNIRVIVDNAPPVTMITTGEPRYTGAEGIFYVTGGTTFTLSATDNLSGVVATEYRIDSGNWTVYTPFRIATEGVHTISYRSTDNVANTETENRLIVIVDDTSPVTSIAVGEPKYTAAGKLYVTNSSAFTLTAADDLSGVAITEYRVDSGSWVPYSVPFTVFKQGDQTIEYRSRDKVTNLESTKTLVVTVDNSPPVTEITIGEPKYTAADDKLYVTSASSFNLAGTDTISDVAKIEYRIDTGQWQTYAPFTLSGEGAHSIYYRSTDNVANTEIEKSLMVVVDNTAPVSVSASADPKYTDAAGTVYASGATIFTLSATDNLSGVLKIESRIDDTAMKMYAPFNIDVEGKHEIGHRSIDNVLNNEDIKIFSVTIDKTPPVTSISLSGPKYETDGMVYVTGTSAFTIAVNDTLSGVAKTEYRIGSGLWTDYTTAFTIASEGDRTVEYRSQDNVTNIEDVKVLVVRVDNTAPVTEIIIGDPKYTAADGKMYITGASTFTLTAADNLSGVRATEYRIDGGNWTAYTPFTLAGEGSHIIDYYSKDNVGHTETYKTLTVVVDNTAPVTTITAGDPKYTAVDGKHYVASATNFTLSATDNLSGVVVTEYRIDGGNWTAYAPFTVAAEGTHTIDYYSKDNLINTETFKRLSVIVDNTPPVTTITTGDPKYTASEGKLYVTSGTTLTLSATDDLSGVVVTDYRINGGNWTVYAPFTLAGEGTHTIDYYSKDNLANTETFRTLSVIVDNTPPVTVITTGEPKYTALDGKIYVTSGTTITLSATDSLSGVAVTEYRIDSGTWTAYAPFAILAEGTHTIDYYSRDNVNHIEALKTLSVIVDNTPPVTTITTGDPKYTAPDVKIYVASGTTFTLSATDNLSGVAETEYRIDGGVWTAYAPLTIPAERQHTIDYFSKDNVNNTEAIKSLIVIVDNTPPVTTITTGDPTYNAADGRLYVASATAFTLSATDNLSGVAATEYRLDGGAWTAYAPFTIFAEGTHTIEYFSKDNVANTEISKTLTVIVDNTSPISTITTGSPQYRDYEKLYVSGSTGIKIEASDAVSGVKRTEYAIDNSEWNAHTALFSLTSYADGAHTIHYRSIDNVGNPEEAKESVVILDKTPPQTSISASDQLVGGVVNTVSPSTFFTLTAGDNLSGVRAIAYRIDEGEWQGYTGSFNLNGLASGTHTIDYKSIDNVLNEETAKSLTVRLIVIDSVRKEVSVEPVVLVGVWSDKSDLEQKQADIKQLDELLASLRMDYMTADNMDDFTSALRFGRYNTYILIDVKEPVVSEEIREAVYRGDGLIFLKTRQDADPFLDDAFGVKLTGRTTRPDLAADLESSPIGNGGELQLSGKAIVAALSAETAETYGTVTDKQQVVPVIISNQYGKGRSILYTFDLMNSPDKAQAAALIVNSINHVRPLEHAVKALDSVPIRIAIHNTAEPVTVKLVEAIPQSTTADTVVPEGILGDGSITWQRTIASNENMRFGYYLNIPDKASEYELVTELFYDNNGAFVLYGTYPLAVTVSNNSEQLLTGIITDLTNITMAGISDAEWINEAIDALHQVSDNISSRKEAESNLKLIIKATDEIKKLSMDVKSIRLKLGELIKIWEKKWYLMK